MPQPDVEQQLMPSILDRLIDAEAGGAVRGYGLDQMMDSVQRDLEDLLNTRDSDAGISEEYQELNHSILRYGLPDLTVFSALTPQQRDEIAQTLEAVVVRFEPRLRDVRARLIEDNEGPAQTIRFRIEARLNVDPAPEVAFDTILELTTGRYSVKPSGT